MSASTDLDTLPPAGTVLSPDDALRTFAGGTVLLGGSPLRLLRLGAPGARTVDRWRAGEPLGHAVAERRLARRLLDAGIVHPEPRDARFTPADVTAVIPVKDNPPGAHRIRAATRSFAAHILVDDGSTTPLPDATVRHDTPTGPAGARNTGWHRAGTRLVAFLDSDVTPEPGWLVTLLPLFNDPAVAAVAPRIRSRRGDTALARYEQERSSLDFGDRPAPVRPMSRVGYVPTAALVVRRSALTELDGFDDRLRFGEDVDLVWRLHDSGHTVRYQPTAVAWHEPRATLRTWLRQRYDYGSSAAPLSTKHPGRLACAHLSRWSMLTWGLLAAGRPLPALATALATTTLFPRKLRGQNLPATEALRLAALGHLGAGRHLAEAVRRTWWPALLGAAAVNRTARRTAMLAALPCLLDSHGKGPSWAGLRLLDDLAYGTGVWTGCLHTRTLGPLLPAFTHDSLR